MFPKNVNKNRHHVFFLSRRNARSHKRDARRAAQGGAPQARLHRLYYYIIILLYYYIIILSYYYIIILLYYHIIILHA